jgi:hypothetical protein
MGPVNLEQIAQVQVTDPISVREHECFAFQTLFHALDPSASAAFLTRISQVNHPIFTRRVVLIYAAARQVNAEVRTEVGIIHEEAFDNFPAMAEGEIKFFEAIMGTMLHDVPDNGPASDLDHRLGPQFGFLRQASPKASA